MKKRSRYRPKPINPQAHLVAMMGVRLLSPDDQIKRALALREATDAICRGMGTIEQWRHVFDSINMAEQWIRMKLASGYEEIERLQQTVSEIMDRQKQTGTKALKSDERQALDEFAATYATLLASVTKREYFQAQEGVESRVRRILAGERIPASIRVLEAA